MNNQKPDINEFDIRFFANSKNNRLKKILTYNARTVIRLL